MPETSQTPERHWILEASRMSGRPQIPGMSRMPDRQWILETSQTPERPQILEMSERPPILETSQILFVKTTRVQTEV